MESCLQALPGFKEPGTIVSLAPLYHPPACHTHSSWGCFKGPDPLFHLGFLFMHGGELCVWSSRCTATVYTKISLLYDFIMTRWQENLSWFGGCYYPVILQNSILCVLMAAMSHSHWSLSTVSWQLWDYKGGQMEKSVSLSFFKFIQDHMSWAAYTVLYVDLGSNWLHAILIM